MAGNEASEPVHRPKRRYTDTALPRRTSQLWSECGHDQAAAGTQSEDLNEKVDSNKDDRLSCLISTPNYFDHRPYSDLSFLHLEKHQDMNGPGLEPTALEPMTPNSKAFEPSVGLRQNAYGHEINPSSRESLEKKRAEALHDLEFPKITDQDALKLPSVQDFVDSDDEMGRLLPLTGLYDQQDETEGSEIEYAGLDITVPSPQDLKRLLKLRLRTSVLRSSAQQKRRLLREMQVSRSAADDRLIQFIRSKAAVGITFDVQTMDTINYLQKESERIRNEYGPLEDELNSLEDELGREEYESLALLERLTTGHKDVSGQKADQEEPPPSYYPPSDDSYIESLVRKPHPLVDKYFSKWADRNNLCERLDANRMDRDKLEEDRRVRQSVGLTLASEDQEFLNNFPILEQSLLKKIKEADAVAEDLRKKCLAKGLIDEDDEEADFATQEQTTFNNDNGLSSGDAKSEFVKYPTLLPDPNEQVRFTGTILQHQQKDFFEDLVNWWLLQQLRASPLAVYLLAATYEAKFGKVRDQWQMDVVDFWYRDDTFKSHHINQPQSLYDSLTSKTRNMSIPISPDPRDSCDEPQVKISMQDLRPAAIMEDKLYRSRNKLGAYSG